MRTILILITLLLSFIEAHAQSPSVSAQVKDAAQQPVPFANAELRNVTDTLSYKAATADEAGHIIIENVQPGNYRLTITSLGYAVFTKDVSVHQEDVNLQTITLDEEAKQLEEVVVEAKKPVVKRKIDRLEFNVENSTLSSDNAWEILKKTPGVTVSSDAVSIRGSSGIMVTINDKRVYLTGTELKNLLENMEGENIKSVEVITTPPAKYEAQGSAILNIKMKKTGMQGYKASVAGAYVQSTYPKGVMSTNQYYKNNKLSVYGGYMLGSGTYLNESDNVVKYFNEDGNVDSEWRSSTNSVFKAFSQNSYNLTVEYQLDSLNSVAVGGNGFSSLKSTGIFTTPTYIYDYNGTLDSLYYTRIRRDYPQKNNSLNGSFEHKFSDKAKVVLSSDYTWHYFNQNQDVAAEFSLPGEAPYREDRFLNEDTRRIKLFSVQADYTLLGEGRGLEAGLRFGSVNADSNLDFFNEIAGAMVRNAGRSNRFIYDEAVYAGYIGYDREFGKWSFKGGLRGEYTHLEGNSVTTNEVNKQDYFKIFPTVYALYKPNDNHSIGLSYGKRIVRPQYSWLNPFRTYASPYAYTTGDPQMQPTISHNLSLLYTLKNKYNFDLFYNYRRKPSLEIVYQDYSSNTIVTQLTNIKENSSFGLDFNTNLQITPWWDSGLNVTGRYSDNIFQGVDGKLYKNDNWNYGLNTNNRFTLTKAKDWTAEANFNYQSPFVQATSKFGDMSELSLSLRKTFMKGNGELTLIISDILRGQVVDITTSYANQYSFNSSYDDTRSVRLQFRYRLGNQKLQGAKVKERTQEQQRL
jgi:hypothetical protein